MDNEEPKNEQVNAAPGQSPSVSAPKQEVPAPKQQVSVPKQLDPTEDSEVSIAPNLPEMSLPKISIDFNFKSWPAKIMHTLREYKRVIIVSKKPDAEEIVKISKVAGLGIILIGVIGFIIQVISQLIVGH